MLIKKISGEISRWFIIPFTTNEIVIRISASQNIGEMQFTGTYLTMGLYFIYRIAFLVNGMSRLIYLILKKTELYYRLHLNNTKKMNYGERLLDTS